MITSVIYALIYICLLAIVVYLIIWVLTTVIGIALPPKIIQLIWVVFALIVLLILFQALLGGGLPHLGRLSTMVTMLNA